MQEDLKKFESFGARIFVVVRDSEKSVGKFWKKNNLTYSGIADKGKKLATLYRQQWNILKLGLMPAMFVIDMQKKIVFAHYSDGMSDIPENEKVFEVLGKTAKPMDRAEVK